MALKFPVGTGSSASQCFATSPADFTWAAGSVLIAKIRRDEAFSLGALIGLNKVDDSTVHQFELNSAGALQGKINWFSVTMASSGTLIEDAWAWVAISIRIDAGVPRLRCMTVVDGTFTVQEVSGGSLRDTTGPWRWRIGGFQNVGGSYYSPSQSSYAELLIYTAWMDDTAIQAQMALRDPASLTNLYGYWSMLNKASVEACLVNEAGSGGNFALSGTGAVTEDSSNPVHSIPSLKSSYYFRIGPAAGDAVGFRAGLSGAAGAIGMGERYGVMLSIKPEAGAVVSSVNGVEMFRLDTQAGAGATPPMRLVKVTGAVWELRLRSGTVAGGVTAETVVASIAGLVAGSVYRFVLDMTPNWNPTTPARFRAYLQIDEGALTELCNVTTPFGFEQAPAMTMRQEIRLSGTSYTPAQTKIDYQSKGLFVAKWLAGVPTLTPTVLLTTLRLM